MNQKERLSLADFCEKMEANQRSQRGQASQRTKCYYQSCNIKSKTMERKNIEIGLWDYSRKCDSCLLAFKKKPKKAQVAFITMELGSHMMTAYAFSL